MLFRSTQERDTGEQAVPYDQIHDASLLILLNKRVFDRSTSKDPSRIFYRSCWPENPERNFRTKRLPPDLTPIPYLRKGLNMVHQLVLVSTARRGRGIMMTRRQTLGSALALGAVVAARPALGADMFPVVETAQGRLRGLSTGGVFTFRGISYAGDKIGRASCRERV